MGNALNVTSCECYCSWDVQDAHDGGYFAEGGSGCGRDDADGADWVAWRACSHGPFLASEGASYITGQVVAIDGGRSAQ